MLLNEGKWSGEYPGHRMLAVRRKNEWHILWRSMAHRDDEAAGLSMAALSMPRRPSRRN